MSVLGHGDVGKRESAFTKLMPSRAASYDVQKLAKLAELMKSDPDTVKDGADPEENLLVAAGYTYFGQFIDHDLTFDSTSSLAPDASDLPTNLRTPRLDLDCVYGDGPDAQPYLYDSTGTLLLYRKSENGTELAKQDLTRNENDRAIIGDKRNDENSIVCQIQLAWIKYHNAVVAELAKTKKITGGELFKKARDEVRWTYQTLIVEDFLPRIIEREVLADLKLSHVKGSARTLSNDRTKNYALYTEEKRGNLPLEFVGAAYRFGHSAVRTGYRLNALVKHVDKTTGRFSIFPGSESKTSMAGDDSLLGFDALPLNQEIDHWRRFFPDSLPSHLLDLGPKAIDDKEDGAIRLQHAYKIDTSIVDPLGALPRKEVAGETTTEQAEAAVGKLPETAGSPPRPSLALLNLLRGNSYRLPSGQAIARALKEKGFPCDVLSNDELRVRVALKADGKFQFVRIDEVFDDDTPLWFYVLAEAQRKMHLALGEQPFDEDLMLKGDGAKTQLGWVGGRIVAEVFYGLLDADSESFVNAAPPDWKPMLGGDGHHIFLNMLRFADKKNI